MLLLRPVTAVVVGKGNSIEADEYMELLTMLTVCEEMIFDASGERLYVATY